MPDNQNLSREALVALCRDGVVAQAEWNDRDSASAQRQLAEAGALLAAGCDFRICTGPSFTGDGCVTDDKTIWVEITYHGFNYFECGISSEDSFYIPTRARLDAGAGKDWY